MSFEILPHTADVRLRVTGRTLQELFSEALKGMNELMCEGFCEGRKAEQIHETITVTSQDQTTLLVDFLSEVLTLSHIHRAIFCRVEFEKLSDTALKARVHGTKVSLIEKDVKAVSYHEAQIKKNKSDFYETILIFDI